MHWTENRFMSSQNWNCVGSLPIPIFMYLLVIYIFPGLVCLYGCSIINRPILGIYKSLTDTKMWKLRDRTLQFCLGNNEAVQFHFWEYINQNLTFILGSHGHFIYRVHCKWRAGENPIFMPGSHLWIPRMKLLFPKQNYNVLWLLSPSSYTHISVRDLYFQDRSASAAGKYVDQSYRNI